MNPDNPTPTPFNPDPAPNPAPTPEPSMMPAEPVAPAPAPTMTTPDPAPQPVVSTPMVSAAPGSGGKMKKMKFGLAGMIVAGVLLLLGLGAGAYYGFILPNKPENKLARAFGNALAGQNHSTNKVVIAYQPKTEGGLAVNAEMTLKTDLEKKHLDLSGTLGVSGTQFPFDFRYLDKEMYFRVGGLDGVSKLLESYLNDDAAAYTEILSSVNNQWYVVDKSFIQGAGKEINCLTDMSFTLSDGDKSIVTNAYKKYPLYKIKSTSSATVDGVATTKYELAPTDGKNADKFLNEFKNLSIAKKISECTGEDFNTVGEQASSQQEVLGNGSAFVYVTGDKKFKKMELIGEDNTAKTTITMTFDYQPVTVSKPEGAKPIQDLLSDLTGSSSTPAVNGLNTLFQ